MRWGWLARTLMSFFRAVPSFTYGLMVLVMVIALYLLSGWLRGRLQQ